MGGTASVGTFGVLGERRTPFDGKPYAVYLPPGVEISLEAKTEVEVAICSAPASGHFPPRVIRPSDIGEETRGSGTNTRYVRNILPETREAERLLVVEVLTPGGHWSSYPPHKHDSTGDGETQLEETYYHRLANTRGFAFQRVYTDDRSLDESMAVEDGDVVLVPRGYHPVGAPHGIDLYYLNTMAGPERRWQFRNAPGYSEI
jgi:5-deoxy-glucuronate isomerase